MKTFDGGITFNVSPLIAFKLDDITGIFLLIKTRKVIHTLKIINNGAYKLCIHVHIDFHNLAY